MEVINFSSAVKNINISRRKKIISTQLVPNISFIKNFKKSLFESSTKSVEDILQEEVIYSFNKHENIKLDIASIVQEIKNKFNNEFSFKHFSVNSVKNKLRKIEKIKDLNINKLFNFITTRSKETSQLIIDYSCKSQNELIQILYNEVKLYEVFIKRLLDLFFLTSLKHLNEGNQFENQYKESNSNFLIISEIFKHFESLNQNKQKTNTSPPATNREFTSANNFKIDRGESLEFASYNRGDYMGSSFNFDINERIDLTVMKKIIPVKINKNIKDTLYLMESNFGDSSSNYKITMNKDQKLNFKTINKLDYDSTNQFNDIEIKSPSKNLFLKGNEKTIKATIIRRDKKEKNDEINLFLYYLNNFSRLEVMGNEEKNIFLEQVENYKIKLKNQLEGFTKSMQHDGLQSLIRNVQISEDYHSKKL